MGRMKVPTVTGRLGDPRILQYCKTLRAIAAYNSSIGICTYCTQCGCCSHRVPEPVELYEVSVQSGTPKVGNVVRYTFYLELPYPVRSVLVLLNHGCLRAASRVIDGQRLYLRSTVKLGDIYRLRISWSREDWAERMLRCRPQGS